MEILDPSIRDRVKEIVHALLWAYEKRESQRIRSFSEYDIGNPIHLTLIYARYTPKLLIEIYRRHDAAKIGFSAPRREARPQAKRGRAVH